MDSTREISAFQTDVIAQTLRSTELLTPLSREEYDAPFDDAYIPAYENLSRRLHASFMRASLDFHGDQLREASIGHGFGVVGRGVAHCALAYARYCDATGKIMDEEAFFAAAASPKTIRFFTAIADMSRDENREYEAYFDLIAVHSGAVDVLRFDEASEAFLPDYDLFLIAQSAADRARAARGDANAKCPAIHFLPQIWRAYLDAAREENTLGELLTLQNHAEQPAAPIAQTS